MSTCERCHREHDLSDDPHHWFHCPTCGQLFHNGMCDQCDTVGGPDEPDDEP